MTAPDDRRIDPIVPRLACVALLIVSCLLPVRASEAAPSGAASRAQAGWSGIERCAALADDASRHACTDEVMRRAGLLGPAAAPSKPHRNASRPPSSPEAPPRPEVTLASVEQGTDGKLVLTTTEGAVWRQVDSDTVRTPPGRGQTMAIKRTLFGGFMCEAGKWVAFRCRRVR